MVRYGQVDRSVAHIKVCYRHLHHQLRSLPLTTGHAPDAALQQAVHTSKYATDSYIISCVPYLSLLDMHQMLHYNKQSTHQSMLQTVTPPAAFSVTAGHAPDAALQQAVHSSKYATDSYTTSCVLCHCWTCTRCCTRTSSPYIKVCYRQLHHQLCSLPLTAGHAPDVALEQAVHTSKHATDSYITSCVSVSYLSLLDMHQGFFADVPSSIKTKKCQSSFILQEQC